MGKDPLLNYKPNITDGILEGEVLAAIERVRSIYNVYILLGKS